jgi:NAD(P)H-hydrate epimerase
MILTAEEARAIDRRAREDAGLSVLVLMENAGAACAAEAVAMRPRGPVVVVCGKGNNGGDGFVCARHLAAAGVAVKIFLCARPGSVAGEAAVNLRALQNLGIPVISVPEDISPLKKALRSCGLAVDALLGTGVRGPVEGVLREAIEAMNECAPRILSVDIPSGLDADTDVAFGACVAASVTVTFIGKKRGMLRGRGRRACGRIRVVQIGIPVSCLKRHVKC